MAHSHGGLAVWLGSGLVAALYGARVVRTDSTIFGFLLFNLTLALVPWGLAHAARLAEQRGRVWAAWTLGVGWLLFLPNAPYLLTDLVHLRPRPGVPLWYDAILLATAGVTGLLAGGLSLRDMHRWVEARHGARAALALVVAAAPAAGVGIYLGRFARWNSWDLVLHPVAVLGDVAALLRDPAGNLRALVVIASFAGLLAVSYLAVGPRASRAQGERAPSPSPPRVRRER
ncbi:MAG: DUF1361 domain-containing protein [Sandaracinaceae bacterium]|nr:DUF1361 domain-containing protein [Sandaracinaceae bacterium]